MLGKTPPKRKKQGEAISKNSKEFISKAIILMTSYLGSKPEDLAPLTAAIFDQKRKEFSSKLALPKDQADYLIDHLNAFEDEKNIMIRIAENSTKAFEDEPLLVRRFVDSPAEFLKMKALELEHARLILETAKQNFIPSCLHLETEELKKAQDEFDLKKEQFDQACAFAFKVIELSFGTFHPEQEVKISRFFQVEMNSYENEIYLPIKREFYELRDKYLSLDHRDAKVEDLMVQIVHLSQFDREGPLEERACHLDAIRRFQKGYVVDASTNNDYGSAYEERFKADCGRIWALLFRLREEMDALNATLLKRSPDSY